MNKSPAFQFYPKDYLTDGAVRRMTYEQRGMYVELLSLCWLEDGLPNDPRALAELLGARPAAFERHWPKLLDRFDLRDDGRLSNPRLEAEREKQRKWREKSSTGGRKGAQARWSPGDEHPHACTHTTPTTVATASDDIAVSSLQSSSPSPESTLAPPRPPVAVPPEGANGHGGPKRPRRVRRILPDSWAPSDAAVAYGRTLGFTDQDLERVTDEFCTYWWGEGKPKADWDATFENRLLALKHGGKR